MTVTEGCTGQPRWAHDIPQTKHSWVQSSRDHCSFTPGTALQGMLEISRWAGNKLVFSEKVYISKKTHKCKRYFIDKEPCPVCSNLSLNSIWGLVLMTAILQKKSPQAHALQCSTYTALPEGNPARSHPSPCLPARQRSTSVCPRRAQGLLITAGIHPCRPRGWGA